MKRPSGFDRAPERPESDAPVPRASEWDAPDSAPGSEEAAAPRPGLFDRLRTRTAREAAAAGRDSAPDVDAVAESAVAERAADPGLGPDESLAQNQNQNQSQDHDSDQGRAAGVVDAAEAIAPTIDLSSVRRSRAADDSLDSERAGDGSGSSDARSVVARWREARDAREADPVRAAERNLRAAGKQRKARFRRERHRFTAAARRRRRTWLIVLSAVAALALFVAVGAFTPLMAVREVTIVGASAVNEDDVAQALARFEGVPLALVDDGDVHRALEPFALIQRYAVERTPPHTMTVRIEERVPVVSLPAASGVELFDAAGVLLGAAETAPVGVPIGEGALTDRSSAAFRSATRALRDMPAELRAQIVSVTASSGQDVTFVLTTGVAVLWGDAEQTRRKATVLSAMLASLGDRPIEQIDVSSSEAPVFS